MTPDAVVLYTKAALVVGLGIGIVLLILKAVIGYRRKDQ